jgi:hypothetical protein
MININFKSRYKIICDAVFIIKMLFCGKFNTKTALN